MEIILQIAIVLLIGKVIGEIFARIGLPETTAFVLTGILVGPVFGVAQMDVMRTLGIISALLLLFFAGLQGSFKGLHRKYMTFYIFNVAFPFIAGLGTAIVFGYSTLAGVAVGAALVTVSISIALGTLVEREQMKTHVGDILSSLTIISNIAGVVAIAIATSVASGDGTLGMSLLGVIGKTAIIAGLFLLMFHWLPRVSHYSDYLKTPYSQFTLILIWLFLVASLVEYLGFSMVLGGFVAGLVLGQTPHVISEDFIKNIRLLLGGFFIMFFFVMIGMQFSVTPQLLSLTSLGFIGILLVIKYLGGHIGGLMVRLTQRESATLGTALFPISINMGLAIMIIAKEANLIRDDLFALFVMFTVLTSVLTPFLMLFPLRKALPAS